MPLSVSPPETHVRLQSQVCLRSQPSGRRPEKVRSPTGHPAFSLGPKFVEHVPQKPGPKKKRDLTSTWCHLHQAWLLGLLRSRNVQWGVRTQSFRRSGEGGATADFVEVTRPA